MDLLKKINNIEQFVGKLRGKKVFLRADFNVPIQKEVIGDEYRIKAVLPTLEFLKREGAVTIIASHIETADVEKPTLKPVFSYIKEKYGQFDMVFCEKFTEEEELSQALDDRGEGTFLLLENIRHASGEKENDINFAVYLKNFAEFYINEAFAVVHRPHCTVDALPRLFDKENKAAGFLLTREIHELSKALEPKHPFLVVLSGMKFSTKLPLIQKYLNHADRLFIAGALFNNVAKSLGHEVGISLVDNAADYIDDLVKTENFKQKVYIPEMVSVKDIESNEIRVSRLSEVKHSESIQDIAEISIKNFFLEIKNSGMKTILWNGPIGNYENTAFAKGTLAFATSLYDYVKNDVETCALIGGGDTVAAIQNIPNLNTTERIFVSTGGGAMLEFLEKEGQLPGIVSLM